MAVTARWENGILVVIGDAGDNSIFLRHNGFSILVNFDTIPIENAPAGGVKASNTTSILIYGMEGNDTLGVDDEHGAMPLAYINGGDGGDTLIGNGGVEWFDGGSGSNFIDGNGGADYVFASPGGSNIDWSVGDGSEVIDDPGDNTDLTGTDNADAITVVGGGANAGYVFFDQTDELVVRQFDQLLISTGGGNDVVSITGEAAPTRLLVSAGAGDDIIYGASTAWGMLLLGGEGHDAIVGGAGNDELLGGAGFDVLTGGGGADRFFVSPEEAGFDYITDFNAAEDFIHSIGGTPLAVQFGAHVLVGLTTTGFDRGFVVLNAIAAEVQAHIIS